MAAAAVEADTENSSRRRELYERLSPSGNGAAHGRSTSFGDEAKGGEGKDDHDALSEHERQPVDVE